MHELSLVTLCLTALIAGVVNSIAGGGTLLTFPALLAVLEPRYGAAAAVVANATSTVALLPGALAGAWGYRRQMEAARRWLLLLVAPSFLGGVVGSLLVTRLDPSYFGEMVPWLLLTAATLFLYNTVMPRRKARPTEMDQPPRRAVAGLVLFQFGVAIYGGYFGAGIGILMLSALAMMGIGDINRMNALKVVLNSCINGISVIVFVVEGRVEWKYAVPMAVVSILGGYLGALFALRIPRQYVRWIVIAIGFGLATYYFVHHS
jgi:uncharacterized membrane protein YfcA